VHMLLQDLRLVRMFLQDLSLARMLQDLRWVHSTESLLDLSWVLCMAWSDSQMDSLEPKKHRNSVGQEVSYNYYTPEAHFVGVRRLQVGHCRHRIRVGPQPKVVPLARMDH